MPNMASNYWKVIGVAGALAGLAAWPGAGQAQLGGVTSTVTNTTSTITSTTDTVTGTVTGTTDTLTSTTQTLTGSTTGVLGLLPGTTAALADTGSLGGTTDAREASALTGDIPSLLTGEVLHATTIGWPDQVASEASLANLALGIAGNTIGADFVMAEALAVLGAAGAGTSILDNLSINGAPIPVSGAPNQTIFIPGGRVVLNEQIASAGGMAVNALRVIVDGVADVVIGSATASTQPLTGQASAVRVTGLQ